MTQLSKRSKQKPSKQTIAKLLVLGEQKLYKVAKQHARQDAEALLRIVLKKDVAWLFVHSEKTLTQRQYLAYQQILKRRAKNTPLAYLRGWQDFYGRRFHVGPGVLIPRPETEALIDLALQYFPAAKKLQVADLGSGSGCIALSLACERPRWQIYATELSSSAIHYARKNAKHWQHKNLHIMQGNMLQPLRTTALDLIVANLPYLKPGEAKDDSVAKEPRKALVAGQDGLNAFRVLFQQVQKRPDTPTLLLEIDPRRKKDLQKLHRQLLPQYRAKWKKDLSGHWRVLVLESKI
ncbi:MAG: peptide chain release factor N(5)-glutamine methyltransferase [Candidatus Nomurabacteria bacterium]|nr:MAG: peptide chain release factor N(5)-glutamine methyltransferase [Candidatus Nomurabacteria bacterium]